MKGSLETHLSTVCTASDASRRHQLWNFSWKFHVWPVEAKDFSSPQKTGNSPSLSTRRAPLSEYVTTKWTMERKQSPLLNPSLLFKGHFPEWPRKKNFPELSPKTTTLFSPKWKPHQLKQLLWVSFCMILRNDLERYVYVGTGESSFCKIISSSVPAADERY